MVESRTSMVGIVAAFRLVLPTLVGPTVSARARPPRRRPHSLLVVNAPARLRALPSWLLSEAARRGHQLVSEGFAAEGLRKPHFTVLVALSELGPASQAELGRRL